VPIIICVVIWTCGANDAVLIRAAGNKQVMRCQEPGGERCWKVAADRVVLASIWYAGETRLCEYQNRTTVLGASESEIIVSACAHVGALFPPAGHGLLPGRERLASTG
jgi:hypothetical protein